MAEPSTAIKPVSVAEAKRELDSGQAVTFLDDRAEKAWNGSDRKIPGALRIPPEDAEQHLNEIPREGTIVTYCT